MFDIIYNSAKVRRLRGLDLATMAGIMIDAIIMLVVFICAGAGDASWYLVIAFVIAIGAMVALVRAQGMIEIKTLQIIDEMYKNQ